MAETEQNTPNLPRYADKLHERKKSASGTRAKKTDGRDGVASPRGGNDDEPRERNKHAELGSSQAVTRSSPGWLLWLGSVISKCPHRSIASSDADSAQESGWSVTIGPGDADDLKTLRIVGYDQAGILILLSEYLAERRIGIVQADIVTEFGIVTNSLQLRAQRPSDLVRLDRPRERREIERLLLVKQECTDEACDLTDTLAATCKKFKLDPDMLRIVRLEKTLEVDGPPVELRYRLEINGIDRSGLLAYVTLLLHRIGFAIVRASVWTDSSSRAVNNFELATNSEDSEKTLRSILKMAD